jgi:beta-glucanase (GH16 family)
VSFSATIENVKLTELEYVLRPRRPIGTKMITGRYVPLLAWAALTVMALAPSAQARPLDRRGLVATFHDEFDTLNVADANDRRTWNRQNWKTWYSNGTTPADINNRTLPGNGENQVYIDAAWPERPAGMVLPHSLSVRDGVLHITANRAPPTLQPRIFNLPYTSGVITSWGMFAQRYGVFEARLRLPKGRGLWPAFWTLNETGGWPPEIDIMEFLGHDVHSTWAVAHSRRAGKHVASSRQVRHARDITADFHVFAVDWRPETLTYYIDNEPVLQVPTPRDMHSPMYIILNLAVGGRWGGQPDAATVFPATFEVDWVRVWQRPSNTGSGAPAIRPSAARPIAATQPPPSRAGAGAVKSTARR